MNVPPIGSTANPSVHVTVLVVDDDASSRMAMEAILEALGYQVLVAASGRDALAIYSSRPDAVDLVISDLLMPELSALELYAELTPIRPDVKMLIMTGYPLEDEEDQVIQTGICGWIQKPFTMSELDQLVRATLATAP